MVTPRKNLPVYRVYYQYSEPDSTRPRKYSVTVNAEGQEDAISAVRARMELDGMPMQRIEITGAALNALT